MTTVYLTCDSAGISVVDDVPMCSTGWVMQEPLVPELTLQDAGLIMSGSLVFFAVCYGAKHIRGLLSGPTTEVN